MTTSRASRAFLAFSGIVWLPYGIYCFLHPGALADSAGIAAGTSTGTAELRAMYGGLQAALGVLAFAGLIGGAWQRHALIALLFVCAGLGGARLLAAASAGEVSQYTAIALTFEIGSTAISAWLLSRS
jgi:hypothetical protein